MPTSPLPSDTRIKLYQEALAAICDVLFNVAINDTEPPSKSELACLYSVAQSALEQSEPKVREAIALAISGIYARKSN